LAIYSKYFQMISKPLIMLSFCHHLQSWNLLFSVWEPRGDIAEAVSETIRVQVVDGEIRLITEHGPAGVCAVADDHNLKCATRWQSELGYYAKWCWVHDTKDLDQTRLYSWGTRRCRRRSIRPIVKAICIMVTRGFWGATHCRMGEGQIFLYCYYNWLVECEAKPVTGIDWDSF
jgi:hypothetical protein